jgi:hypothetical protein
MSRQLRIVTVAIVTAFAAAGCGGTSTGTGTSTTTSSSIGVRHVAAAKPLVARADPICKLVATKREAANNSLHGTSKSTLETLARLAPKVSVVEHQALTQLLKLKAPAAVAQDWREMLAGIKQLADDTTQISIDAKANDLKAVEALTASGRSLRTKLTAIAERDGFAYCGRTS